MARRRSLPAAGSSCRSVRHGLGCRQTERTNSGTARDGRWAAQHGPGSWRGIAMGRRELIARFCKARAAMLHQ